MSHSPIRVAGLVLAAGFSRRMGSDKLLLPLPKHAVSPEQNPDDPLVVYPARAARDAGLCPLLAVVRPNANPALTRALAPYATLVEAPLAHLGQAESLKAGVRALLTLEKNETNDLSVKEGAGHAPHVDTQPQSALPWDGLMVLLGDQPLVSASLVRLLVQVFVENNGCRAVAPACEGVRGNPVILPRRALEALLTLKGDTGARGLLQDYDLRLVETSDRAALYDVDTWAAYEGLRMNDHGSPQGTAQAPAAPRRIFSRPLPWMYAIPWLDMACMDERCSEKSIQEESNPDKTIPDDATCFALSAHYGILDHIQAHCVRVADFAEALARRALEVNALPGASPALLATLVPLTRAAGLLHDVAKAYTIQHGGSHAQIGASWTIAHTGNRRLGQAVLHHVEWPWELPINVCLPVFFVNYADRRVKHDAYVSMTERYEDLLERYGTTLATRGRLFDGWKKAKNLERALAAQLELPIHACTFAGGRLVERT